MYLTLLCFTLLTSFCPWLWSSAHHAHCDTFMSHMQSIHSAQWIAVNNWCTKTFFRSFGLFRRFFILPMIFCLIITRLNVLSTVVDLISYFNKGISYNSHYSCHLTAQCFIHCSCSLVCTLRKMICIVWFVSLFPHLAFYRGFQGFFLIL